MRLLTTDPSYAPLPQPWVRVAGEVVETVERVAFWSAILIPLAYLLVVPALILDPYGLPALLTVIVVHALALLAGHHHDPPSLNNYL